MENTLLTERLLAAAGDRTYRSLAELTSTNAETVRRYMQGQAPSVEFLAAVCVRLGISEQWLISGRGPMKTSQVRSHALNEASVSELLSAMARTLERLGERVDRLELFLSSLEVRLRGRNIGGPGPAPKDESTPKATASVEIKPQARTPAQSTESLDERSATNTAYISKRAQHIADAVPERPRKDDR